MRKALAINPEIILGDFPDITFKVSDEYFWSAKTNTIHYVPSRLHTIEGVYRLIHEIGHAINQHKNYESGVQLLSLETEAWETATEIAKRYDITIDPNYVESCLDSYRDWLHARSSCPNCKTVSVEVNESEYKCFNCLQKWCVSGDQRTRCYRQKLKKGDLQKKTP